MTTRDLDILNLRLLVLKIIKEHPEMNYGEVGRVARTSCKNVSKIALASGVRRIEPGASEGARKGVLEQNPLQGRR